MTISFESDIDQSGITSGQQVDAVDVNDPVNDIQLILENLVNGVQEFEVVQIKEVGAPTTPGSGKIKIYTKTGTDKLYFKDDTGTERELVTLTQTQTLTNKTLTTPTINTDAYITGAVTTLRRVLLQTSGSNRWGMIADGSAETGSPANSGSDFLLARYTDGGAFLGNGFLMQREDGAVTFPGFITKTGGGFTIDHPLDPENKDLIHSFVEAPRGDNIYRGKAILTGGTATVDIDLASDMTPGAFAALNKNPQVWLQNDTGWDAVKGAVAGGTLTITCQNPLSTDTISWMVVAERKDAFWIHSKMTDAQGNLIVEKDKIPLTQREIDQYSADRIDSTIRQETPEIIREFIGRKGYPRNWEAFGFNFPTRMVRPS